MKTIEIIENNVVNNSFYVNFDCLNTINGNRQVVDLEHIARIEEAMRRDDFIPPVIVDRKTLLIIDGQHRNEAARNIWRKGGQYKLNIILDNFDNPLLAAINYNRNSKRWTTENYVNAYITDGRKSFELLKKFCESHPLLMGKGAVCSINYSGAAQMITHSPCNAVIPKGTLQITEDQCHAAEETYQQLEQLMKVTNCDVLMQRHHVLAWIEVRDVILAKTSFDKFAEKMAKYFVAPAVSRRKVWVAEYLRVAVQK